MTEDITILGLADRDRWEAEHAKGGLPSQSWSYAWGLSASGIDPKLAIVHSKGARMLLPFFERTWKDTTDVATLPGLSGALISPNSSAPLSLWREFAVSQGWIAGYIQLAPSTDLDALPTDSHLGAHDAVYLFDLQVWDPMQVASRTIRRKIDAAQRCGATIEEDTKELADRFVELYPPTMRRLGVKPAFSRETLHRWLRSRATILLGVRVGENIEAVHLGHLAGDHAEWHIAATSEGGRSLGALIYVAAAERLRNRGIRVYNMGGSGGRNGVGEFKRRLGGSPAPLNSLRQIYNREIYYELCGLAAEAPGNLWFPAYRTTPN